MGEVDALLEQQANSFAEDLAIDEEDGRGGLLALEGALSLLRLLLADLLVVAVEVLFDALGIKA